VNVYKALPHGHTSGQDLKKAVIAQRVIFFVYKQINSKSKSTGKIVVQLCTSAVAWGAEQKVPLMSLDSLMVRRYVLLNQILQNENQ